MTPDSYVIANYHVVSSAITKPGRYRVELIDRAGTTIPVSIAAIDVVHDLASLRSGSTDHPYFRFGRPAFPRGAAFDGVAQSGNEWRSDN